MRLVPIDSTKNYVQILNQTVATLSVAVIPLATAVSPSNIDETDVSKVGNVEEGCMIKRLDIDCRLFGASGVSIGESAGFLIRKNEGLAALGQPSLAQCNALGAQSWKARIFHAQMATPGNVSGLPMVTPPIKVPKRFHVMHANDKWELVVWNNSAFSVGICGFITYKWYR